MREGRGLWPGTQPLYKVARARAGGPFEPFCDCVTSTRDMIQYGLTRSLHEFSTTHSTVTSTHDMIQYGLTRSLHEFSTTHSTFRCVMLMGTVTYISEGHFES